MLACNCERWCTYKNAALLLMLSRRHNWPSKLKLRDNQTVRTSTCGCNSNSFQEELVSNMGYNVIGVYRLIFPKF